MTDEPAMFAGSGGTSGMRRRSGRRRRAAQAADRPAAVDPSFDGVKPDDPDPESADNYDVEAEEEDGVDMQDTEPGADPAALAAAAREKRRKVRAVGGGRPGLQEYSFCNLIVPVTGTRCDSVNTRVQSTRREPIMPDGRQIITRYCWCDDCQAYYTHVQTIKLRPPKGDAS